MLSPDLLGLIQDSTITEDTTTLCGDKPRRKLSSKKKSTASSINTQKVNEPLVEREDSLENSNEHPLQFGFENIVFEMDNRCDDQKAKEPIRYCSLAQFVEGNDIARKSFKVRYPYTNNSSWNFSVRIFFHLYVFSLVLKTFFFKLKLMIEFYKQVSLFALSMFVLFWFCCSFFLVFCLIYLLVIWDLVLIWSHSLSSCAFLFRSQKTLSQIFCFVFGVFVFRFSTHSQYIYSILWFIISIHWT